MQACRDVYAKVWGESEIELWFLIILSYMVDDVAKDSFGPTMPVVFGTSASQGTITTVMWRNMSLMMDEAGSPASQDLKRDSHQSKQSLNRIEEEEKFSLRDEDLPSDYDDEEPEEDEEEDEYYAE